MHSFQNNLITKDGHVLRRGSTSLTTSGSGQATLSFILLVSGLVLEIAIAGSFVTYFFSASALGERLSARAFSASNSGIRDAQMRITRSKDFTGSFTLQLGADSSAVTVTRTILGPNYVYTITSVGTAGTRQRTFVATITADQTSGIVTQQAIVEQAVQ